nr:putative serpin-Z6C [Setaria viridis]
MAAAAAAQRLASSGPTVLSHRLMKHFAAAAAKSPRDGACSAGNLVFSPLSLSIYSSFSVMAAGARGRTLSVLLHVVCATCREGALDEDAPGLRLPQHRRSVGRRGPRRRLRQARGSKEADQQLNVIDSILDPAVLGDDACLMLANAVYFEGRLERSFAAKCRNMEDSRSLHRLDGSTVDAEFICSDEDQFIETHDGFKVLKMMCTLRDPFHGVPAKTMDALLWARNMSMPQFPRHSMYIVLPDAHDGLWSLHDKMASSPSFLHEHLPEWPVNVGEFRVPKLRISFAPRPRA